MPTSSPYSVLMTLTRTPQSSIVQAGDPKHLAVGAGVIMVLILGLLATSTILMLAGSTVLGGAA